RHDAGAALVGVTATTRGTHPGAGHVRGQHAGEGRGIPIREGGRVALKGGDHGPSLPAGGWIGSARWRGGRRACTAREDPAGGERSGGAAPPSWRAGRVGGAPPAGASGAAPAASLNARAKSWPSS